MRRLKIFLDLTFTEEIKAPLVFQTWVEFFQKSSIQSQTFYCWILERGEKNMKWQVEIFPLCLPLIFRRVKKPQHLRTPWVAQRLRICLRLRAWFWSPGRVSAVPRSSHTGLPAWSLLLPLPPSLCLCVSDEWINKILKKKKELFLQLLCILEKKFSKKYWYTQHKWNS